MTEKEVKMSLRELVPTLDGLRETASRLADSVDRTTGAETICEDWPDFHVGGAAAKLRGLAEQLEGQVRTAHRPFTVAVVGEFNVGKSTFLNGFLGLLGEAALSANDDPDTACSILLNGRSGGDPEARLHFKDGTTEETSWERAKGLTSQVWLNGHPEDVEVARELLEVEYLIAHPLLGKVQINDLPGTGSRYWREHTALTHDKMKQADAILWVVGETEPSADGRRNLEILADCSQQVLPIVNVFEDPETDPPLPRDDAAVARVCSVLMEQYAGWFSPDLTDPIQIASRVVVLERARTKPDAQILADAGLDKLKELAERFTRTADEGSGDARVRRVCGAGNSLGNEVATVAGAIVEAAERWETPFRGTAASALNKLDEVEAVRFSVRGRVRTLARDRAIRICGVVSDQGRNFVEDTLQLSNVADFTAAITKGRGVLEEELTRRFIDDYLRLNKEPNWLDELGIDFAEDVRDVAVPAWRELLMRLPGKNSPAGGPDAPTIELGPLRGQMVKAIMSVVGRILGIAAVAGLLAIIPGGQVVDAIAIVGFLVIAAIADPLAGSRRRAVDRIRLQVETQQYELQNRLLSAGMEGSDVLETAVREALGQTHGRAEKNLAALREMKLAAREGVENATTSIRAFDHFLRGVTP